MWRAIQVFPGFAKDYNAYLDRHSLNVRKLPQGFFVAYAILKILRLSGGSCPVAERVRKIMERQVAHSFVSHVR